MSNFITSITRRDVSNLLINGWDEFAIFGNDEHRYYNIWGVLTPHEFLNRLFPLETLPSLDLRLSNASEDIFHHTVVNPNDYTDDWFWNDSRFNLSGGSDENLLDFIVEIFHPEVRDDRYVWGELLNKINELLVHDGYVIVPISELSKRTVYGWKSSHRNLCYFNFDELHTIWDFFNRRGYVLDFKSRKDFNNYLKQYVGFNILDRYRDSMGKSLFSCFIYEDEATVNKICLALWNRYLEYPIQDSEKFENEEIKSNIVENLILRINTGNIAISEQVTEIKQRFDNAYIQNQIDEMVEAQETNPTKAIGLAKELIESTCKSILLNYNESIEYDNLPKLLKATTKILRITPDDIPDDIADAQSMKTILRSFASIVDGLANLRNKYGSGHGKPDNYKGLESRHAKLAIGASSTLAHFLWDCFEYKTK